MTKLVWDSTGSRHYEAGVDRGVFYPRTGPGEAWNGLSLVKESPSSEDVQMRYVDGVLVQHRRRSGDFEGTIEAYTYPESFEANVISRNRRIPFGMSYRVSTDTSYKIHLVYNILLAPSSFDFQHADVSPFSWDFTTRPNPVPGARSSAHLIVDASKAYPGTIAALEAILYGDDLEISHLPLPWEVLDIFEVNSILRIVDNGDGTWTATGPDGVIEMLDETTFQINWASAVTIDEVSYTLSSL